MQKVLFALLALAALSGCSTITGDRYNHVNIATTPQGAEYEVRRVADNAVVASGVTPNLVKLKSSAGYFKRGAYTVKFHKPGYQDTEVKLSAGMRGIYWGNILVGGPIGLLIVDPASGAMWALPKATTTELTVSPTSASTAQPLASASGKSKDEQLQELMSTPMGYEEYMRRYKEISQGE